MSYAKRCDNKPVGFVAGAKLYKLKPEIEFRNQELSVSPTGTKATTAKTDHVVISPGVSGQIKVFPANKEGLCMSWFYIGEPASRGTGAEAILKKLGYTLN